MPDMQQITREQIEAVVAAIMQGCTDLWIDSRIGKAMDTDAIIAKFRESGEWEVVE